MYENEEDEWGIVYMYSRYYCCIEAMVTGPGLFTEGFDDEFPYETVFLPKWIDTLICPNSMTSQDN